MALWMFMHIFLYAIFLPIVGNGADAPAVEPPQTYKAGEWHIIFEVVRTNPKVTWVGQVWEYGYEDGSEVLRVERRLDITSDCQVFGTPTFFLSVATFDGAGDYVACTIPDFPTIFADMEPELAECRCFYTSPPWATANVRPATVGGIRPIIHHPRLQLDVQVNDPIIDAVAYFMLKFFDGTTKTWETKAFPYPQDDGAQIWAGYNAQRFAENFETVGWAKYLTDVAFWDAAKVANADGFYLWESEVAGVSDPVAMPDSFGLGPGTTLYFGYNPDDGSYYSGRLIKAIVNPGCRAG